MPTPKEYVDRANRINEALNKHQAEGRSLSSHLVVAGAAAGDVLKELLEDKAFWTHLGSKKPAEDDSSDPYAPIVTQYHAAVLTALGYKPPPPAAAVAEGVSDLIKAKRGGDIQDLEEVRRSITALKDSLVILEGQARAELVKPSATGGSFISEKLKKAISITNNVILTGAALVGMFFGPLFPPQPPPAPPAPPPVIIVIPLEQLPPHLRNPPAGAEERGRIFFYKALPPPEGDSRPHGKPPYDA